MPRKRTEEHDAFVKGIFRTREGALACILDGMPGLPEPIRPTHYTESEPPRRMRTNCMANRDSFEAFIAKARGGCCLACARGHYTVDLDSLGVTAEIESSVIALDGPPLNRFKSQWGIALLELFAEYGSVYGYCADWEEYLRRHQHVIPFIDGGEASGILGRDIYRYVPGLYWLNYYSDEYCHRMAVNPATIAERLAARTWRTEGGTFLQLYDDPQEWPERNADVEAVIDSTPNFFSIRRVPVPRNITKYEYLRDETGRFSTRQWQ